MCIVISTHKISIPIENINAIDIIESSGNYITVDENTYYKTFTFEYTNDMLINLINLTEKYYDTYHQPLSIY